MGERMKAAILYNPYDLRIGEVDKPTIDDEKVLIRIDFCGICPSDVRGYTGMRKGIHEFPYVPGHEWVGHIVELGRKVKGFHKDDRVVPDWRAVCGKCYFCRRGIFNYCENLARDAVRGGFCEYGYAISPNIRLIPNNVSYVEACFTEPLACCINGIKRCNIQVGDDVVIVGSGPIGLMHLQLAKHLGARVISCDIIDERLEKAKSLGADELINPSKEDPIERTKELTEGRGANAVIVAVGGQKPIEQGIGMAGTCGTINIFAGTYPATTIPLDPNLIHYKQLFVTGSHDYTPNDFTAALKLIANRTIQVKPLVSHILPLEKTKEGYDMVVGQKGLKVIIEIV
ncbi:MAG: zinc-binding dehydrogenase [Thermoproteota archaeon]